MSRRVAREVAMKLVFAQLFDGGDTYDAVLEKSGIDDTPTEDDLEFSEALVTGIDENSEAIDALINEAAYEWSSDRMSKVDYSILRIAVYEMCYRDDIPVNVSINEAVELAKHFGGEKSPAFINGLLGTIARKTSGE
ncbi:MAG: transcription antitermination factor NusB [Clostridia bacterium]|nr:transcription antitermination factor NusB [Clostridia bacterium]